MRQDLIDITHEMEQILIKLGQAFRANAYKKAATSLEKKQTEITTQSDQDLITKKKYKYINFFITPRVLCSRN